MLRLKTFLKITLLGGLGVLLPLAVFAFFVAWLFGFTTKLIQPLTNLVLSHISLGEFTADAIVILVLMTICFLVGLVVKTGVGIWMHNHLDHILVRLAPGYKTVKDIVQQFFGSDSKDSLMKGEVVRAWIYGRDIPVSVTAILTSRHADGDVTVYVPTAPVPTSGLIYHVPLSCVDVLPDISVEKAMRTILSCGAGSASLFNS